MFPLCKNVSLMKYYLLNTTLLMFRKVLYMDNAINVNRLTVSYLGKIAIENVSFTCQTGNLIGIIGPNGAGKSTLIQSILSLIPKDSGTVSFQGQPMRNVREKIAYVQQRSDIDWDFPILVRDVVLLGTYPKLGLLRRPSAEDRQLALDCLKKVGMDTYANQQIGQLSGGQQQRVFLARALAQKADYFFLDEPFVGVDMRSEREIVRILKEIRDEGKTIFIVHHDLTKVEEYFDELLLLNKHLIAYGNVEEVLTEQHMSEAYNIQIPQLSSRGADK